MRITARGVGLLGAAATLLGAGFGLGYPELTVLGTAALVAAAFALAYVGWRPRLGVSRHVDPDRVMRGESSRVSLTVRNASRFRGVTLVAHDRCGDRSVPVPLLRLRPGRDAGAEYPVPTARRGVVRIGPLQVVRRDPLGLVALARASGPVADVWVYPRVHPLTAVPVGIVRSLDGLVDRVPQGSITFDTLREYVLGDELRHVHWRTTARMGQLMVREHVDTSLPRLVVLLDDRAAAYPVRMDGTAPDRGRIDGSAAGGDRDEAAADAFEVACEAAASIVMAAVRAELPVALRLVRGGGVGGENRARDPRAYLDLLTEAVLGEDRPSAEDTAHGALDRATARLRQQRIGDTLIYLTGSGGRTDLGRVGALRGRYPTIVVGVLGGVRPDPSTQDGLMILAAQDGAEFARVWDGMGSW